MENKNNKALSRAELELTQKIQTHFPSGVFTDEEIGMVSNRPKEQITEMVKEMLEGALANKPKKILEILRDREILIPELKERFMVAENFNIKNKSVRIKIVEGLDAFSPVIYPRRGYLMSSYRLEKTSLSRGIEEKLKTLGLTYETDLAAIFNLMKRQPNGEFGYLIERVNLFFVRGIDGVPHPVQLSVDSGGWVILAYKFLGEIPWSWNAGTFVFATAA